MSSPCTAQSSTHVGARVSCMYIQDTKGDPRRVKSGDAYAKKYTLHFAMCLARQDVNPKTHLFAERGELRSGSRFSITLQSLSLSLAMRSLLSRTYSQNGIYIRLLRFYAPAPCTSGGLISLKRHAFFSERDVYYAVGGSSSFNVDHRRAQPSPRQSGFAH